MSTSDLAVQQEHYQEDVEHHSQLSSHDLKGEEQQQNHHEDEHQEQVESSFPKSMSQKSLQFKRGQEPPLPSSKQSSQNSLAKNQSSLNDLGNKSKIIASSRAGSKNSLKYRQKSTEISLSGAPLNKSSHSIKKSSSVGFNQSQAELVQASSNEQLSKSQSNNSLKKSTSDLKKSTSGGLAHQLTHSHRSVGSVKNSKTSIQKASLPEMKSNKSLNAEATHGSKPQSQSELRRPPTEFKSNKSLGELKKSQNSFKALSNSGSKTQSAQELKNSSSQSNVEESLNHPEEKHHQVEPTVVDDSQHDDEHIEHNDDLEQQEQSIPNNEVQHTDNKGDFDQKQHEDAQVQEDIALKSNKSLGQLHQPIVGSKRASQAELVKSQKSLGRLHSSKTGSKSGSQADLKKFISQNQLTQVSQAELAKSQKSLTQLLQQSQAGAGSKHVSQAELVQSQKSIAGSKHGSQFALTKSDKSVEQDVQINETIVLNVNRDEAEQPTAEHEAAVPKIQYNEEPQEHNSPHTYEQDDELPRELNYEEEEEFLRQNEEFDKSACRKSVTENERAQSKEIINHQPSHDPQQNEKELTKSKSSIGQQEQQNLIYSQPGSKQASYSVLSKSNKSIGYSGQDEYVENKQISQPELSNNQKSSGQLHQSQNRSRHISQAELVKSQKSSGQLHSSKSGSKSGSQADLKKSISQNQLTQVSEAELAKSQKSLTHLQQHSHGGSKHLSQAGLIQSQKSLGQLNSSQAELVKSQKSLTHLQQKSQARSKHPSQADLRKSNSEMKLKQESKDELTKAVKTIGQFGDELDDQVEHEHSHSNIKKLNSQTEFKTGSDAKMSAARSMSSVQTDIIEIKGSKSIGDLTKPQTDLNKSNRSLHDQVRAQSVNILKKSQSEVSAISKKAASKSGLNSTKHSYHELTQQHSQHGLGSQKSSPYQSEKASKQNLVQSSSKDNLKSSSKHNSKYSLREQVLDKQLQEHHQQQEDEKLHSVEFVSTEKQEEKHEENVIEINGNPEPLVRVEQQVPELQEVHIIAAEFVDEPPADHIESNLNEEQNNNNSKKHSSKNYSQSEDDDHLSLYGRRDRIVRQDDDENASRSHSHRPSCCSINDNLIASHSADGCSSSSFFNSPTLLGKRLSVPAEMAADHLKKSRETLFAATQQHRASFSEGMAAAEKVAEVLGIAPVSDKIIKTNLSGEIYPESINVLPEVTASRAKVYELPHQYHPPLIQEEPESKYGTPRGSGSLNNSPKTSLDIVNGTVKNSSATHVAEQSNESPAVSASVHHDAATMKSDSGVKSKTSSVTHSKTSVNHQQKGSLPTSKHNLNLSGNNEGHEIVIGHDNGYGNSENYANNEDSEEYHNFVGYSDHESSDVKDDNSDKKQIHYQQYQRRKSSALDHNNELDPVIDPTHMILKPKHLPKKATVRTKSSTVNSTRPVIPVVKKGSSVGANKKSTNEKISLKSKDSTEEKKPCHTRREVDHTSIITALRQEINSLKVELGDEHQLLEQLREHEKQLMLELEEIKNNVKEISSQNARLLLNHQKKAYTILIAKFRLEIRRLKFQRNSLFDPVLELKYFPHLPITNFGNTPRKPPVGIIGNTAHRSTDYFVLNPPPSAGTHPDGGYRWWWGEEKTTNQEETPKPEKPEKDSEFKVGQRIAVYVEDEKCFGVIKYLGPFDAAPDTGVWAGIKLDRPVGRHDGVVKGKRYFKCEENHGYFAKVNKLRPIHGQAN